MTQPATADASVPQPPLRTPALLAQSPPAPSIPASHARFRKSLTQFILVAESRSAVSNPSSFFGHRFLSLKTAMEDLAAELGVPVNVLLHGLPQRLHHASDGVILRRFARLASHGDFLHVRDPTLSVDLLQPLAAAPLIRGHIMPYMTLRDACAIYLALEEEKGGPSTSYHRQIVIMNPGVLQAKYTSYCSIIEKCNLLDSVSESVEAILTVRLQAQFEACVADQWLALDSLRENAWRLVLHYLNAGDILEAKQYLGLCFPRVSQMIDDNPAIAYDAYDYLLTSLQENYAGEELNLSVDTQNYLASLACFRLLNLKATNLGFIIAMVESFLSDLETKRDYLMGRLTIPTLMGAAFAN